MRKPRRYTADERTIALAFYQSVRGDDENERLKIAARKSGVEEAALLRWIAGFDEADLPTVPDAPRKTSEPEVNLPLVPDVWENDDDETDDRAEEGRPYPPPFLADDTRWPEKFVPAPELSEWTQTHIIDRKGVLYNEEHWHLEMARIGFLWTNIANTRQGRTIIGTAEIPGGSGGSKWSQARELWLLDRLFGEVPDFIITLDAVWCQQADAASFCALVEHEMYHCAFKTDNFGVPKLNRKTGKPEWKMRGHDIEEFLPIRRRYGARAAQTEALEAFVGRPPEIGEAKLAIACGSCLRSAL